MSGITKDWRLLVQFFQPFVSIAMSCSESNLALQLVQGYNLGTGILTHVASTRQMSMISGEEEAEWGRVESAF